MKMSGNEVWKDVLGYEGLYQVSNKGNVYSVERRDVMGRKWGGHTLKPASDKDGYLTVNLCKNGIIKNKKIHRLVSEAFIPNPNNFTQVNHRDEDKTNNNVGNMEWCDIRYNNNYGTRIERLSKKVRAVNIKTGEVLAFSSTAEVRNKGYDQGNVSRACRGVYNRGGGNLYKGHKWSYEEEK